MEEEKLNEVKEDIKTEENSPKTPSEKDRKCNIAMGVILFAVVILVAFVIAWALGCVSLAK